MNPLPPHAGIIAFIASGPTLESPVAFGPSAAAVQIVEDSLAGNRNSVLSSQDKEELDDYLNLEHFMILVKAVARQKLQLSS